MIIDSHCHVGLEEECEKRSDAIGVRDWHNFLLEKYPTDTQQEITLEKLINDMNLGGVDKAIISGWDIKTLPPANWEVYIPNDYVNECVDKYPDRFVGSAGINPMKKNAPDEVSRCVNKYNFVAIKLWPPAGFYPSDKEHCYPIYEKCVDHDIPIQIHTGPSNLPGTRVKFSNPLYLDDVAMDFPDLKIHMIHSGWPFEIKEALQVAFANENIYLGLCLVLETLVAGFPYHLDVEVLKYMELRFPERVLFGTDYVGKYFRDAAPFVKEERFLPISEKFRENILGKTAIKLFKIRR